MAMKRIMRITVPDTERHISWHRRAQWDTLNGRSGTPCLDDAEAHQLHAAKARLDSAPYNTMWETYKRYNNQYELIHTSSNRKRLCENIAFHAPLSRSYFKMWEMICDFSLFDLETASAATTTTLKSGGEGVRTAHLAEGPGGFIEAVSRYRLVQHHRQTGRSTVAAASAAAAMGGVAEGQPPRARTHAFSQLPAAPRTDRIFGITLQSAQKEVPGWNKSDAFLRVNPQVRILYGEDGTGNLYRVRNIDSFCTNVREGSCMVVTADGGFDFSVNFDQQEVLATRLLLCEVYAALRLTRRGGTFICKFFDTYHRATLETLWILACTFDHMNITKPHTSRPANSERYIVAQGYRGHTTPLCASAIVQLRHLLEQWGVDHPRHPQPATTNGQKSATRVLTSMLDMPVPPAFEASIRAYNRYHAEQQMHTINMTLALIDRNRAVDASRLDRITAKQVSSAVQWCLKYRTPINDRSSYLDAEVTGRADILKHNRALLPYYHHSPYHGRFPPHHRRYPVRSSTHGGRGGDRRAPFAPGSARDPRRSTSRHATHSAAPATRRVCRQVSEIV